MRASGGEHATGKLVASEDVLALQTRKLFEQILDGVPAGQIFQDGLHRVAQTSQARLAVADFWIYRNARSEAVIRHEANLQSFLIIAKTGRFSNQTAGAFHSV